MITKLKLNYYNNGNLSTYENNAIKEMIMTDGSFVISYRNNHKVNWKCSKCNGNGLINDYVLQAHWD